MDFTCCSHRRCYRTHGGLEDINNNNNIFIQSFESDDYCPYTRKTQSNNNNNHDNVYGAVIMAEPLRVHPVHLMNVEWRQAAADPRPSQSTIKINLQYRKLKIKNDVCCIYYLLTPSGELSGYICGILVLLRLS